MVRVWDSGVEYLESRTWLVEKFHLRIEWKFWKTSNVLKLRIPHRGTEGIGASVACTRLLIFGLRKWKGSEKFSLEAQEVRVFSYLDWESEKGRRSSLGKRKKFAWTTWACHLERVCDPSNVFEWKHPNPKSFSEATFLRKLFLSFYHIVSVLEALQFNF